MRSLFVIHTPFQLINAISIVKNNCLDDADFIMVHKNMEHYSDFAKQFCKGNVIFAKELYDNSNKVRRFNHINLFNRFVTKRKRIKKYLVEEYIYDRLFVPSDDLCCRAVYSFLKQKGEVILNLFDDGVGTYTPQIFTKKPLLSRFVLKVLLKSTLYENLSNIYCYRPELITVPPERNIKLFKINQSIKHSDLVEFEKKIIAYKGKKVVFFDQGFSNGYIFECLNLLKNYFQEDEIIIKKHPRIIVENNYSGFSLSDDGLPAEFIFLDFVMDNVLLISHSSTSCLSPYLLMNQRPVVIMLRGIGSNNQNDGPVENYFSIINNLAGDNYIKTPKSIEEFKIILDSFHESIEAIRNENSNNN